VSRVVTYPLPDVVIPARATVGEGPVFDRRTGRLCWVDIDQGLLFENDLRSGDQRRWSVDTMLGAAAPRATQPGFAVAVSEGLRFWAGSTHMEFTPGVGALHRWNGREPSTVAANGFSLPNGLGWNVEDSVMYLADSMTRQLLTSPYSAEDGEVGQFSELCTFDAGLPDGLTVDVDGCMWIAMWSGSEVHRYDPVGRLVGRIPMPVEKPSSCAFGDDGTLYITSATADIDEAGLLKQPLAGSVFAISTDTHGVPVQPFAA